MEVVSDMIQRVYDMVSKKGCWSLVRVSYRYRGDPKRYYELRKKNQNSGGDDVLRFGAKNLVILKRLLSEFKDEDEALPHIKVIDMEKVVVSGEGMPNLEDWYS
jgi:hypothetical protein